MTAGCCFHYLRPGSTIVLSDLAGSNRWGRDAQPAPVMALAKFRQHCWPSPRGPLGRASRIIIFASKDLDQLSCRQMGHIIYTALSNFSGLCSLPISSPASTTAESQRPCIAYLTFQSRLTRQQPSQVLANNKTALWLHQRRHL